MQAKLFQQIWHVTTLLLLSIETLYAMPLYKEAAIGLNYKGLLQVIISTYNKPPNNTRCNCKTHYLENYKDTFMWRIGAIG